MKLTRIARLILLVILTLEIVACVNPNTHIFDSEHSQVQLRQMQSRAFDTTDRQLTLRTVIQTLQDLNFIIDRANLELGMISATKHDGYHLKMTVSVLPRGDKQVVVRLNAQYGMLPVTDPQPYQNFFNSLEKAMFLTAHRVD